MSEQKLLLSKKPKLTIATTVKNGAKYLCRTVSSILDQTFTDYEHVVVDGGSEDGTQKILEAYDHIKWISVPDTTVVEGQRSAISLSTGEYIMFCCVSDGYLDRSWFQRCVDILDSRPDISLVYGLHKVKWEDGSLSPIIYSEIESAPPPQGMAFFPYWLATFFPFHEANMCVRTSVFKAILPDSGDKSYCGRWSPFMKFRYNFNISGYLPYFEPIVACYTRVHNDSLNNSSYCGKKSRLVETEFIRDVMDYRIDFLAGRIQHVFRDGNGRIIQTIHSRELPGYRRKVWQYRAYRNNYFDYIDPINLSYLRIKFNPKADRRPSGRVHNPDWSDTYSCFNKKVAAKTQR
ncbi:MAG: glycosyltransferase [bacterium]